MRTNDKTGGNALAREAAMLNNSRTAIGYPEVDAVDYRETGDRGD